jgi:hypothetical protein
VIVAASGPSLDQSQADRARESCLPTIAVNDAYRLLPFAEVLYACDSAWWRVHKGAPDFEGEKWSSHGTSGRTRHNDKFADAEAYGLNLIKGQDGTGFSLDPDIIHYGSNGGFQAVNMAGHFIGWSGCIVLIGFNLGAVNGQAHFFGKHPKGLRNTANYQNFIEAFERAAKKLPPGITILNATPNSALKCFPKVNLDDALESIAA